MSPAIRDPSLNTAECVIKGHDPIFEAKGRSSYIRAVLWLSLIFVIVSGPLLAKYVRDLEELSNNTITIQLQEEKHSKSCVFFLLFHVNTGQFAYHLYLATLNYLLAGYL